MALRLIDGFDTYATGNYTGKWASQTGTIGATGREGTNGLQTTTYFEMAVGIGNEQLLIAGMAFKFSASKLVSLIEFKDGTNVQLGVSLDNSNQLIVKRGTTTIASTGYSLSLNTWYYLEFKGFIHNSTGYWDIQINGVSIGSASGIDTQQTGNAYATSVNFAFQGFGAATYTIDDVYIFDGNDGVNDDFVGDVHVEALFPVADGYLNEWVAVPGGGGNYEEVDDTDPDDDATFVVTSGTGLIDSYEFGSLVALSGSVYGVQVNIWSRKDDVGDRQLNAIVRPTSTTFSGAVPIAMNASYQYATFQFDQNPQTAGYWTISQINASEFGVKQEA